MFKAKKVLCLATAAAIAIPVSLSGYATSAKASPKASKVTTINIWCAGNPQTGVGRVNKAINAYLAKKRESVRINFSILGWGDTYGNKCKNMFATGGSDADIVFTCSWVNNFRSNANKGYYVNLNSYLKTKEGKKVVSILGSDFLGGSKIDGKNYALPCNKEKAHDWGFLVRTDLAKKYGLTNFKSIKSTKDLVPYFKKAKADGKTALCVAGFDAPWHFLDWDMVSDDGIPLAISYSGSKNGKVIDPFIDSKSVALFKEMKSYNDDGYISKDAVSAQGIDAELTSGKYFCGVDSLKPGKDKEESLSTGYPYTQIDITKAVKSNRETTGSMMAVNNYSKNKAAAEHALALMYTDKTVTNLLVFGQKGVDYTMQKDGRIKTKKSDYAFANGWMIGNQFNDYLLSTESTSKWKNFLNFNKAKALPSLGFMFNDAKVSATETACANTVTKYYKQLIAGACDVEDTVSKLKSELAAEHESDLIKEAQTQYTKWLKTKK